MVRESSRAGNGGRRSGSRVNIMTESHHPEVVSGVGNALLGLSTAVLVCEIRPFHIMYPRKKESRIGIPSFVFWFQCRVLPQVF